MNDRLTVAELEARWEKALMETRHSVMGRGQAYHELKSQAAQIIDHPLDIKAYYPTVNHLLQLLDRLDPTRRGSIFDLFRQRIAPTTIWQVGQLRMECRDLLVHLAAFDAWNREKHHLRRVK